MALRWRRILSRSTVHARLAELTGPISKCVPCPRAQDLFVGDVVADAFVVLVSGAIETWFTAVLLLGLVQRAVSVARRVKRSSLARPGAVHLVGLGGSFWGRAFRAMLTTGGRPRYLVALRSD